MQTPDVSIIVPVYKTERYLRKCIDSLISQTLKNIEIIIVDDGSPDNSGIICDEYAKKDDRIKVVHKENQGLGMARNTGLENATGKYIGFVDSDDYVMPQMYEVLFNAANAEDYELALSGIRFVGGNMFSESETKEKEYFTEKKIFKKDSVKELMLGTIGALPEEPDDSRYGVSVCKNIFLRESLIKNRMRFQSERDVLSEDTLFMIEFISHINSAIGVPGTRYCYQRNESSLSKAYREDRPERTFKYLAELERMLKAMIPRSEYKIYFNRLVQGFGRVLCSQEIMYARENEVPFRDLIKRLKLICKARVMKNAMENYPWYRLPLKQAVFAFTLKYRLYLIQILLVILRSK